MIIKKTIYSLSFFEESSLFTFVDANSRKKRFGFEGINPHPLFNPAMAQPDDVDNQATSQLVSVGKKISPFRDKDK